MAEPRHHVGTANPAEAIAEVLIETGFSAAYGWQDEVARAIADAVVLGMKNLGWQFTRKLTKEECDMDEGW